jgi:kynurenine formamidase
VKDNTGRWGEDDEQGALNLVTPEVTRRAAGLVSSGLTLSLAEPLGPTTPVPPHRRAPSRFMDRDAGDYALGARSPGFKFAEDTVQFATHSGTHVDALAHLWDGEHLYNKHAQKSTRSTRGAQRLGAEKLTPVLTRGVLVDLVAAMGGPLEPSTPVSSDDLLRGIRESGIEPGPGDAVLIRTGWYETRAGGPEYFANEPGITAEAAEWLADRDVSLVGADNYAVELQESRVEFPAHLVLLHRNGVPLIENMVLAALADHLADASRSAFLFVFAPVPLQGSTAGPLNPLAVL